MKGLEEIAVIHSIDDYNEAMFLEGFLKWIGVAFFDYTYNDLYDEFNQYLENSGEKFDAIIYINDEGDKYISRFGCLSRTNIKLSFALYSMQAKTTTQNLDATETDGNKFAYEDIKDLTPYELYDLMFGSNRNKRKGD